MKRSCAMIAAPVTILIFGLPSVTIRAGALDSCFIVEDKKYVIDYCFHSTCSESLIMNICYDFEHLVNFAEQPHTEIRQDTSGLDFYVVIYDYQYLFYRSRSVYSKRMEPQQHRVFFRMIDFSQNIGVLPGVVDSYGYYEVTSDAEGCTVRYFQETSLDADLEGFYLTHVRSGTEAFLRKFENYIRGFEDTKSR